MLRVWLFSLHEVPTPPDVLNNPIYEGHQFLIKTWGACFPRRGLGLGLVRVGMFMKLLLV